MSVFSNPRVIQQLKKYFVPVAIDINFVLPKKDKEGTFFRELAEQGHYAGRTKPTSTRQGLYIATVDGKLLSSINSSDPNQVIGIMSRALAKWDGLNLDSLSIFERGQAVDPDFQIEFPKNGIVLRETMRDLPRTSVYRQQTWQHNFDHVWLTEEEVKTFVPANFKEDFEYSIPKTVVQRLAKHHMVDQVRGEADIWASGDIKKAKLDAKIVSVTGDKVKVRLSGSVKCVKAASGETNPFMGFKITKDRSVDLKLRGWLIYNKSQAKFESFDFLAVGERAGTAVYNFRSKDMGPEPIGFAFELLSAMPKNMVRPGSIRWGYFE